MKKNNIPLSITILAVCLAIAGCNGYTNQWLYTQNVSTVYVEMFENETFRRGMEYTLTDALVKRIEAQTPYKIVSDRNRADTIITGRIVSISESILAGERQTGLPLEEQVQASADFSWKNLKTGKDILPVTNVKAAMSFSDFQDQTLEYANDVTANKLAQRIVEKMQLDW